LIWVLDATALKVKVNLLVTHLVIVTNYRKRLLADWRATSTRIIAELLHFWLDVWFEKKEVGEKEVAEELMMDGSTEEIINIIV